MTATALRFEQPGLLAALDPLSDPDLDGLDFGVIGFDAQGVVRRYNAVEQRSTGLHPERTIGQPLFTEIAQCMNNYLVAQRFEDAADAGHPLDDTIDFVLTWRMRPVAVKLRMLSAPPTPMRYVLLQRAPR